MLKLLLPSVPMMKIALLVNVDFGHSVATIYRQPSRAALTHAAQCLTGIKHVERKQV